MKQAIPDTNIFSILGFSFVCFCMVAIQTSYVAAQEDDPFRAQIIQVLEDGPILGGNWTIQDVPSSQEEATTEEASEEEDGRAETVSALPPRQVKKLSEKYVRFHMWDGSIVGGEVQLESIGVQTEFGTLQVPIRDIRKFYPGLNSFPELNSKIKQLIEGLGDKNFDVREKSHRELTGMGAQIRNEIDKYDDGGSAERKKRIAEIKKEIDEQLDSMDEDEANPLELPLIRGDRVDTPGFSIVGKIEQQEFILDSKFGELRVTLGDVRMADRSFQDVDGVVKKKFDVDGHTFFQKKPLSTRIRVSKGDKISIKADGSINWTNWSTTSTPEGLTNQGKYKDIFGGTLCARIGSSGEIIKVGSKSSFVAKQSGFLFLAIAMQDSYTKNSGYRWVGKYKARVEIKPAGK